MTQAEQKPQEAPQRRNAANGRFEEANKSFGAALAAFSERVKDVPADVKELPVDMEWAARARCDQAEMQSCGCRSGRTRGPPQQPFVKDGALTKSRYRSFGLYLHGVADFFLKDYQAAGRSLGTLTVLADPVFGTHARYLLARIQHTGGEGAEAATQYEAVIAEHAKQKAAAVEALKRPDQFKNDPEEKTRLEALVRGPNPDHVNRASLYLGVLLYESNKFADAQTRIAEFAKANPNTNSRRMRMPSCASVSVRCR